MSLLLVGERPTLSDIGAREYRTSAVATIAAIVEETPAFARDDSCRSTSFLRREGFPRRATPPILRSVRARFRLARRDGVQVQLGGQSIEQRRKRQRCTCRLGERWVNQGFGSKRRGGDRRRPRRKRRDGSERRCCDGGRSDRHRRLGCHGWQWLGRNGRLADERRRGRGGGFRRSVGHVRRRGSAGSPAFTGDPMVYVGGYDPNVRSYRLNRMTGALAEMGGPTNLGNNPAYLAVNPSRTHLYAGK